jgi:hypothetical protein
MLYQTEHYFYTLHYISQKYTLISEAKFAETLEVVQAFLCFYHLHQALS